jgi:hypothetical protein
VQATKRVRKRDDELDDDEQGVQESETGAPADPARTRASKTGGKRGGKKGRRRAATPQLELLGDEEVAS